MEKILFIHKFLKNWREVGSVTPSSKFLVKKMLKSVNFSKAKIIVELGPGSGCVTEEILAKMRDDAELIVFETNAGFSKDLQKIKDKRLAIYNESAVNLDARLSGRSADYIISGIPLATLSSGDKKKLLQNSYKVLAPNGVYVQFQYSTESYEDLKKVFDKIHRDFTPLNFPPAFVFSCLKK